MSSTQNTPRPDRYDAEAVEARWQRVWADEGAFTCGGIGTICCHGHITTFNDGLCGPVAGDSGVARPDSGIPLCQMYPFRQGCPCTAGDDAGVETCDGAYRMECAGGLWQPSDHACSTYCDLIP